MKKFTCVLLLLLLNGLSAFPVVKFDEGSVILDGLLLLQDNKDASAYYYLPQFPTLASRKDSSFEFLCVKYVGADGKTSGGLFHALFEFTVPPDYLLQVEKKLKQKIPGAKIMGPVPILPPTGANGSDNSASFEIVSAILNNDGTNGMTRSLVASGNAPLTPGSKAAVAALLDQRGATLMWSSFTGAASDVSVGVKGYYEAAVRGYNATVTADMEMIYNHFNSVERKKTPIYEKNVRKTLDSLARTGGIKIEVFDRAQGLGIRTEDMEKILDVVTTKITDMMFDFSDGPMKAPQPETQAELSSRPDSEKAIKDAGKEVGEGVEKASKAAIAGATAGGPVGIATGIAGIAGALPSMMASMATVALSMYDNQLSLKEKKTVNLSHFRINLSKSTTIKVPFYSAGNLGTFYLKNMDADKYFKIVNMNDAAFQRRDVNFQVDGDFVDAFGDLVNFVTVNFRKSYSNGQPAVTNQVIINKSDLDAGIHMKTIGYPRLGLESADWLEYEYQTVWSLKGNSKTLRIPAKEEEWKKSSDPAIALAPPLVKEYVDVGAERNLFQETGYATANVNFATTIAGQPVPARRLLLRAGDAESHSKVSLYHDPGEKIVYQASWYSGSGENKEALKVLESNYLFLVPPPKK